jgi:hypothetical protein
VINSGESEFSNCDRAGCFTRRCNRHRRRKFSAGSGMTRGSNWLSIMERRYSLLTPDKRSRCECGRQLMSLVYRLPRLAHIRRIQCALMARNLEERWVELNECVFYGGVLTVT